MTHLEIKSSRYQYIMMLIAAVGFVAGGIFLVIFAGPAWVGWISIIFFGSTIPIFIWKILDSRPRLIIDDNGIVDSTLGIGTILWEDIENAYVKSIKDNDFICLELSMPEKYIGQLNSIKKSLLKTNERLGFTPISLNLTGVDANTNQVLELIVKNSEMNRNKKG